ncbi:MAG TPA: polysaccharide biosynthesis tyrosine autokinase [Baekduia sp.]|nr:polysaccharide biosynthesis tyrosine autokinase [Baekduia sp.]
MGDVEPDRADTVANALAVLRRRWAVLAACVLACALVALVLQQRRDETYKATASVAFNVANLSDTALEVNTSSGDPARNAATNVLIARSNEVAAAVARELKTAGTASQVLDGVSVAAAPNADVLDISAEKSTPAQAQAIANAFARQYIAFEAKSQIQSIDQAEQTLQAQLAALPEGSTRATAFSESLQRLAQLRAVANGDARIISRAGMGKLTGMGLKLSLALAILLGLALGLAIVFVLEAVDRRLTRIEDLEAEYRLPALTAVPQSGFRTPLALDRREGLEPYRILRSGLDISAVGRDVFTVLVTSAVPGEGKTTVAVDLAQAVALTGRSVTLVELDLRRPTFSRHLPLDPRRGVTTLLSGRATLSDVLVEPFGDLPSLAVLPSGQLPPNPSELLGSQEVEGLLTRLAHRGAGEGRMLVIDAPPLLPVADTQVLLNNAAIDTVLVVTRSGRTTRDEIRRARGILDRHLLQPLGLVVAGVRDAPKRYGYEPLTDVAGPPAGDADPGAGAPPRRQTVETATRRDA